ncbi:Undecaprenyl-diphosphatase [bacterium HR40]|nr:Undecaprenyl-diphosphatase [bacterium HR40]
MDPATLAHAALLGIVEGLTEFLPVSSTGHLILLVDLLGFRGPPGKLFEVVIQCGAILAVCLAYAGRFARVLSTLDRDRASRAFVRNILLAFLPAMVLGASLHGFIKDVLFDPRVVSIALVAGGIAILVIERRIHVPRVQSVETMPARTALGIGFCQTLAMIPGVSRSGATIMGALLLGVERRTAAEFSFFLAVPTMFAAAVFDLYKNREFLSADGLGLIATGFLAAFLSALLVVQTFVAFVGRHGFAPFAWYRIVLGCLMLSGLAWR